jgi:adenosylcobinamide-GDP ribazoletransferase
VSRATDGARLALGTLTVLPVRPPSRVDRSVGGLAMMFAPIAVLPVAVAAVATAWAGDQFALPPLVAASLTVAVLALATGGLHLDGLADTVDGLATHGTRARRLEVMRRGDVGPSGAAALLLVLLVQIAGLAGLLAERGPSAGVAVVLAVVVSRATLAPACMRGLPAARSDGLGHAVIGTVPPLAAVLVVGLTTVVVALVAGLGGLLGVLTAAAAVAAVLLVCRAKLGGSTGDVLGACVEIALAAFLVAQVSDLPAI